MSDLEKISMIDKNRLSKRHYFIALLEEGERCGLLSETKLHSLQMGTLTLLAQRTQAYTGGESSSVKVEVAERLMASTLYTLGLALKPASADEAIDRLLSVDLMTLYREGLSIIAAKLKIVKQDHRLVQKNKLSLGNVAYQSTLVEGIEGFFKCYDPDYSAHEINITLDYPLCNPCTDLVGIELIQHYLVSVYFENQFCQFFSEEAIERLFSNYHSDYKDLLINIFEQVFTTALGCILAQANVHELRLEAEELAYLQKGLSGLSLGQIQGNLNKAYQQLTKRLSISSPLLLKYMEASLPRISKDVHSALGIHTLEKVFIVDKHQRVKPQVKVNWGEKMPDEVYRKLNGELIACRYDQDRLTMINSQVHSLADLEDLFLDGALDSGLITQVLKTLAPMEIAAFLKRYPYEPEKEERELDDPYLIFSQTLNAYILSLSPTEQGLIVQVAESLVRDAE